MTLPGQAVWRHLRDARLWRHPGVVVGGVMAALAAGLALLAWATAQWGLGANSDGLTYLVLARHWFRAGVYARLKPDGWAPMTHFPPGYPQVMVAFMPFTQGDEAAAARIVALLALAGIIALAARVVFRFTRHAGPTVAVAWWLALAFPLQRVVTLVLSESLFLVQILALAWALDRWHATHRTRTGVLVGLLAAWAVFTRWIGIALVLWAMLDTWWAWRHRRPQNWPRQAGAALLAAGVPVAALALAGAWAAHAATGRRWRWHPPGLEKWRQAAETVAGWVRPLFATWSEAQVWAVAAGILVATAALVWVSWRVPRAESFPHPPIRAYAVRWGGLIVVYWAMLALAIAVADASTPMDWRLLAPVFVALSLLWAGLGWQVLGRWWPTALLLLWLWVHLLRVTWAYDRHFLVRQMHNLGAGLRSNDWQQAEVWPVLRALPQHVVVVTNKLQETEYYAERPAWLLLGQPVWREGRPYVYDVVAAAYVPLEHVSGPPKPWGALVAQRWQGECVVIAFITLGMPEDDAAAALDELTAYLTLWQQVPQGALFLPPDAPPCYNGP